MESSEGQGPTNQSQGSEGERQQPLKPAVPPEDTGVRMVAPKPLKQSGSGSSRRRRRPKPRRGDI